MRRATCLLLPWLCACDGGGSPASRQPPEPRPVTLVVATTITLPRTVQVTGTLAPLDELVLGFQVPGRLFELPVDVGDTVRAGERLAALEKRDFELEAARASAALDQARARLGLHENGAGAVDIDASAPVREAQAVLAEAILNRDRQQELVQANLAPQANLDAATATWEVAKSRLQRANDEVRTWIAELEVRRLELEVARKRLQDASIDAPWPGRVLQRHAARGQFLTAGSSVITLLRTDPLRLRLQVPERSAGLMAVGQPVTFTVDGDVREGQTYSGTVVRLGPAIDRLTRTLLVEAEVANPEGALRPGGFCRAQVVVDPEQSVVAVPRQAVQSFAGVDRVFLVQDGRAQERLVALGRAAGERVEVKEGLQGGESVVAEPRGLWQGAPVQVRGD